MKGLSLSVAPSKILQKKWQQKEREMHKRKLRSVKSSIREQYQSAPFGNQGMNLRNGKKTLLMECKFFHFSIFIEILTFILKNSERYTEIERANRILLEKMSNIMQNPKPNLYNPNTDMKKSLNREQRRKDLIKITVENQAILRRL